MDGRFTITNMTVEMGAKVGFMPQDKKTLSWLQKKANIRKKISFIAPDKDATYSEVYEFDITRLSPKSQGAQRGYSGPAETLKDVVINEAFLGTCTNGRLDDLKVAASLLRKGLPIGKIHRSTGIPSNPYGGAKLGLIQTLYRQGSRYRSRMRSLA